MTTLGLRDLGFLAASSGVPWTPANITTALWLDAADSATLFTTNTGTTQTTDGEVIGRWQDKSGNSINATIQTGTLTPVLQTQGLNNLPAVYFNGGNQLNLPTGFLNQATEFTVAMVMRGPLQNNDAVFGPTTANSVGLELVYTQVVSLPTLLRINGSNRITSGLWSIDDTPTITAITGSASLAAGWRNGLSVSTVDSAGITALNFNGQYSLGSYSNALISSGATGPTVQSVMRLSEFIILLSSVSSQDRQRLEGYLAHKWDLTTNLPGNHPYKTTPPTV